MKLSTSRRLSEYGTRCTWMRSGRFLKDLEGDNIDSDIIDEELRFLQEDAPTRCRDKVVKVVESNPWQVLTCLLVLLDAIVVVIEILLDLNGLRSQYKEARMDLQQAIDFLKELFSEKLMSYDGDNIAYILKTLRAKHIALASADNSIVRAEDNISNAYKYDGKHIQHSSLMEDNHSSQIGEDGKPSREDSDYYKHHSHAYSLFNVAHIFHYISIAILGFFVLQVVIKLFGMGRAFFRKKMEIFDAVIIIASFTLDLAFLEGLAGVKGEEAIALLVVFLLWRVLRVINGMMVAAERRQEFRVRLQKRARRSAEKRIEYLEDEKNWKEREVVNLRNLCRERGVCDDQIAVCRPMRRSVYQKMDTSSGLSSIASLSLVVSMSMSRSGRAMLARSVLRYGSPRLPLLAIVSGGAPCSAAVAGLATPMSSRTYRAGCSRARNSAGGNSTTTVSRRRYMDYVLSSCRQSTSSSTGATSDYLPLLTVVSHERDQVSSPSSPAQSPAGAPVVRPLLTVCADLEAERVGLKRVGARNVAASRSYNTLSTQDTRGLRGEERRLSAGSGENRSESIRTS